MNRDTKILNETLANQIQEHITNIIHPDQVDFIPEIHGWFNICKSLNVICHMNSLKDKNHIIRWAEVKKAFYKVLEKSPGETRDVRSIPQHNKGNVQQPTTNSILNRNLNEVFPLKSGQDNDVHSLHLISKCGSFLIACVLVLAAFLASRYSTFLALAFFPISSYHLSLH